MTRIFAAFMLASLLTAMPAYAGPVHDYIYSKCLPEYGKARAAEKAAYYEPIILRKARQHHLDGRMLAALIWHESNFNPREISSCGALGLMQIMPFQWADHHVSISQWQDPETNIELGCQIFGGYRERMEVANRGVSREEILHRSLVCYNMGPGTVRRGITRSRYSRAILKDAR